MQLSKILHMSNYTCWTVSILGALNTDLYRSDVFPVTLSTVSKHGWEKSLTTEVTVADKSSKTKDEAKTVAAKIKAKAETSTSTVQTAWKLPNRHSDYRICATSANLHNV